jgi:hypothetical protein
VAEAQAEANMTLAVAGVEISELQHRSIHRMMIEEARKQLNIETITAAALPMLDPESDPSAIEDDWIANFFEKCRLISDQDMQALWSRVLAGEANAPGSYSKRTVNFLGSLDKGDAQLFASLCRFSLDGGQLPLVYDHNAGVYKDHGLQFSSLKHLDSIGLISFGSSSYRLEDRPKRISIVLYGNRYEIEFVNDDGNDFKIGRVMLTQVGRELAALCSPEPVPGFEDYLADQWVRAGYVVATRLQDHGLGGA